MANNRVVKHVLVKTIPFLVLSGENGKGAITVHHLDSWDRIEKESSSIGACEEAVEVENLAKLTHQIPM